MSSRFPGSKPKAQPSSRLNLEPLEAREVPAAFTPGNFVVERIGTGAAALTNLEPIFLDEYTPAGTLVQSVALPTSAGGGNNALFDSGTATSNGQMTRSVDGRYLTVSGAAGDGATPVTANNSTRVIGVVNAAGVIDTSTTAPNSNTYNTNNFRGVVSTDGTKFFTSGTATTASLGGARYWGTTGANAATTQLSSTVTNIRSINIFGGQLFISSASGSNIGINAVGSGVPTTSGQTTTLLTGTGAAANAYAFVFLDRAQNGTGLDTLYVADQAGGILKFSSDDGTSWTARGSVTTGAIGGNLTASLAADGTVQLYFTSASGANNGLSTLTDSAAYNANLTGAPTVIVSGAGANRVFRGIAWAPEDTAAPTVTSISRQSPSGQNTAATSVTFRVTFNKAVFGVDANDFALAAISGSTATGTIGAVTAVAGSGNTQFDVVVSGITGTGDLRLNLVDNDTITESRLAPLGGFGAQNFASGEVYTIGAAATAGTPTVSNATTNEDTQTTSGLVVTANTAGGDATAFYKVTGITGGTLFKNDGTTAITNGSFITKAEGAAGLKFTPAANQFGGTGFGFNVQAATTNTDAGLGGSVVAATVTVNAVADTPGVTNATANEDTQTASGLVVSRNAADGAEVTHFKITNIQNGTLFLNDGTTAVAAGSFVTFAQANAGLKFTPAANFFGTASFDVRASLSNADAGLGGNTVTATVTVNPVADTPSVTNATTDEDTQTTGGLVVSRNAADGSEVTHFKVTGITGGTLFQNDGTTAINNGDFITFAQANAGLKFTPNANFNGTGSFQVQASLSNSDAGLGGAAATATVTVNAINDPPVITSNGGGATAAVDVNENTTAVTTAAATDVDGNTLTYSITGDDADKFQINSATGVLTFKAAPDFETKADANGDGVYEVTVIVGDGNDASDSQAISVTVRNVNEAPVITSNGGNDLAVSVAENATAAVTTVTAADPDAGSTLTYTLSGADAALFDISPTGVLTFKAAPDFETPLDAGGNNVYDVTVTVSDGALSDTQDVAVTVTDEAAGTFSFDAAASSTVEGNSGTTSATITVTRTGGTDAATVDYATSDGTATAGTDYAAASGTLAFGAGITSRTFTVDVLGDTAVEPNETVSLTLSNPTNGGAVGGTNPAVLTITDDDAPANQPPAITSDGGGATASVSVAENATAVTTVAATDPEGQTVTYGITGGADAALFQIDGATGALTFKVAPDFEAPADADLDNVYLVTVAASDGSQSDTQAISVTVTGVNDNAPVITSNGGGDTAAVSAAENATAVTTVVATDADRPAQTLTYTLSGADAALFDISSTGVLTFKTAPDFETKGDADGDGVYEVTVQVSDGSLTDTQAIRVTVADVNEAPVITSNGGNDLAVSVAENATAAVATVTAADPDAGAALTYTLSGADAALFDVSPTGVLTFKTAPNFEAPADAGLDNVYDVTVTVTDNGTPGLSDAQAVRVTVTNVNEAPAITSDGAGDSASVSVAENATAVTTVTAADPDAGATLTYSLSGPDAALFDVSPTGVLTFKAAPDFETPLDADLDNVYLVTVTVSDGSLSDAQNLSVTVTPVNDNAPVITGGATASASVAENATAVTTVVATDADRPAQTLTYTLSGPDAALFDISSTGVLTFKAAPDFESPLDADTDNVYLVTVTVSDGGTPALTASQAISVTVTGVNDNAPVITSNGGGATAPVSVAENATAVTTVVATDADRPAQALTYSITGGADAGKFTIDSATGVLRFVTAPNFEAPSDAGLNNVYDVTVTVSDGTLTDTQAIAVTVTNVNEAPAITSPATASAAENTTAVTTVTASDPDAATTFSYSITGGADAGKFAIDSATGALRFVAAPDFESPTDAGLDNVYDVTVTVTDSGTPGLSDSRAVAVTVTPVNDNAPVITSNGGGAAAAVSLAENTTAVAQVAATDADRPAQPLAFSVSGPDAGKFAIDSATGVLRFVAAPDFETPGDVGGDNVYNVTVTASDGTLTDTQSLTITVTNVNDNSPVITSNGGGATATVGVPENTTAVAAVTAADADAGSTLTYTLSGPDAALFSISPTGALTFKTAPNFERPGDANDDNVYEVTVTVSDGTRTDAQALSVAVTDVPETPVVTPPSPQPPVVTASAQFIAIGTDAGALGTVRLLDAATRAPVREFVPFAGFTGGLRVALADVTGDGRDDLVVATATQNSHVKVFDGVSGSEVRSFLAFPGFTGGVDIAAGDVDGDGRADVVVGAATGSSHVKVFSGRTGAEIRSFFAFPGFTGGVKVAAGDVTGDGRADVAVLAGPGGNGHVKVFDGATGEPRTSFLGYQGYAGDIDLAVGDADGDGRAEVITVAQNPAAGAHVKAFDRNAREVRSFFAPTGAAGFQRSDDFPVPTPGTAPRVGVGDVNGDRVVDYLLGTQPTAGASRFAVIDGATRTTADAGLAFGPLFGLGIDVDL